MDKIKWAQEIFEKNGIKTRLNKDNMIIISHYAPPKDTTFKEMGIDEDELLENVIACEGKFETRKSNITKLPLVVAKEIVFDKNTKITQLPNLKAVGLLVANEHLKKMPKLKACGFMQLENSSVKTLPKLKEIGILIAQNSALESLPNLQSAQKICIIDCPFEDLKALEKVDDLFICSSDEEKKIDVGELKSLKEVKQLFVANSTLKNLSSVKTAQKIALFNTNVKNIKSGLKAEIQIENKISDEVLSNKFDEFTDWYNSDVLNQSINMIGNLVNYIQG